MYSSTKSVPILATRGCPYQCTYCSAPNMWTPRWIARPKQVVDEIEYYVETFGAELPVPGPDRDRPRQWIIDFCNELLDATSRSPGRCRPARGPRPSTPRWPTCSRTNMISMAYAPESGSETTRQLIKKKMKSDRLFESMQAAVDAELNVSVFMVIGFPTTPRSTCAKRPSGSTWPCRARRSSTACTTREDHPRSQVLPPHLVVDPCGRPRPTRGSAAAKLTYWKFRLMRHFYRQPRQLVHSTSLFTTVVQALRGPAGRPPGPGRSAERRAQRLHQLRRHR